MGRLNPAGENYQIEKLLREVGELKERLGRSESDAHSPSGPVASPLYTLSRADDDPDIIVWRGAADPGGALRIPINTLMRPAPDDPDVMVLPFL